MATHACGDNQLFEENGFALNSDMSNDEYMKTELEAENELMILQGFCDEEDLSKPVMNIKSEVDIKHEVDIKTEPDDEQIINDTHKEQENSAGDGRLTATQADHQDGGEIKKVQFTDVKITNQTAMMEDLGNEKLLKSVFVYPVRPEHMAHPFMLAACKKSTSFSVNFFTSELEGKEQVVGILNMKMRYYEGVRFVVEKMGDIKKNLTIGVQRKNNKTSYYKEFFSKFELEPARKVEYNARGYLYVANIPRSATEEELEALFPGAKSVILAQYAEGQPKGYGYVNYETEVAAKEALYNQLTFPMILQRHQLVVFYYSNPTAHRRQVGMKLPGKRTISPPPAPKATGMSDQEKERLKKQLLEMRQELDQVRGVNEGRRQEIGRKMQVIERRLAIEKLPQERPHERPRSRPMERSQQRPTERPQQRPTERPQQRPQPSRPQQVLPHQLSRPQSRPQPLLHNPLPQRPPQQPLLREPPLQSRPQPPRREEWVARGRPGGAPKRKMEPPGAERPMSSYASSYIATYGNEKYKAYADETEPPAERQPRWADPHPSRVPSLLSVEPAHPIREDPAPQRFPPLEERYRPYDREPPVATEAVNLLLGITEVLRQQTGLEHPRMPGRHGYDGYDDSRY